MDLTDMLKEASIIDLSWQTEGLIQPGKLTFDPKAEGIRKRNNTKPELEVEWGNAGPTVDLNEPAGEVVRNIPQEDLAGAKDVIVFARDQMNRGKMGKALTAALKAKFDPNTLKQAAGELRKLFALEGIIGCIAVDGRGYPSCQDALKTASNSPYKRFIQYIIGCECGDPHCIPTGQNTAIGPIANSSGNSIDDFMASEAPQKTVLVSHCRSTMLPILSWRGDLDQSMTDQTLIDLGNMSGLPESQYSQLWGDNKNEKFSSNLARLQNAFRKLNAHKEKLAEAKYAGRVDNSEFVMDKADNEIEFGATPMADLDVDPVDPGLQQEVEPVEPFPSTTFDGPPTLFSEISELELAGEPDLSQIPVEMTDEENRAELLFDDVEVPSALDVQPQSAMPEADIPLFEPVDVEMNQFEEEEFEGIGDIELEDEGDSEDELDISMMQDMRI